MSAPRLPRRDRVYLRLAEYIRGDLPPDEAADVARDLARDPGLRRAADLLALGMSVDAPDPVDAAWASFSARATPRRGRRVLQWAEIIVAAVVVLVIGRVTYLSVAPLVAAHANERYAAPMDARRVVRLPDGSRATLEPGARLGYRASYFRRPRALTLDGEARFQVHPDIAHPFEVVAQGVLVTAVGTVFTVRANTWDSTVGVSVEQGSVMVWADTTRTGQPSAVHAGEHIDVATFRQN